VTASSIGSNEGAKKTRAVRRPTPARRSAAIVPGYVGYLFVAPFVVAFIAILIVPIGFALYLSLFQTRLIGGETFAGLGNYLRAAADPKLRDGLLRVLLFLVIQVPIMLALSLGFALALDSARVYGARAVRLLIFVPYAIPGVVGVLVWGYLYGTRFGLITQLFGALGLPPPQLLSSQNMLGSMMNIVTWQYAGYNMIVMFSALRAIPGELFEAAVIDGANQWQIAWRIKVPAIRAAIALCVIFSGIGAFQVFTEPNLMQPLAPTVVTTWYTPSYYAYNSAFLEHNTTYAATLAFALGLVIAVTAYIVQFATRRRGADT
jgi:multiple sugar transport system permease protein